MGFDKVKIKQVCLVCLYIALLILGVKYSEVLLAGIKIFIQILMPFLIGGAIAFILNIPLNGIEKKLLKKWQGNSADKLKRPIGIVLSILFVVTIISLVLLAVVPQIRSTIVTVGAKIPAFYERVVDLIADLAVSYPVLQEQLGNIENLNFNWNSIITTLVNFLKNGVGSMFSSTVTMASSIVGVVANFFIAFVFAIYILSQKEKLQNQVIRIMDAYLPKKADEFLKELFHRLYTNFVNFICGQCAEAVILGCMFIIAMTIFGLPYALMVGALIAFTALIPIVGAFIGCSVGVLVILIEDPIKALWFLILFLIIQQIEGNLIYPKVVGNSVGLPSIWVLASVSIGGSLFGVAGMLVFIPLMSTVYSLIRDDVNVRNERKLQSARRGNAGGADENEDTDEGEDEDDSSGNDTRRNDIGRNDTRRNSGSNRQSRPNQNRGGRRRSNRR